MQLITDGKGVPLSVSVASAGVGETAIVQQTLGFIQEDAHPSRLVGDKAYDSDPLDNMLAELGIEMIAPHRRNRRPESMTEYSKN